MNLNICQRKRIKCYKLFVFLFFLVTTNVLFSKVKFIGVEINIGPNLDVIVSQTPTQPDPSTDGNATFQVEFSEPIDVSTFTSSDISLTGTAIGSHTIGAPVQVAPNDGTTFEFTITGLINGKVTAAMNAGVVNNLANDKLNTASLEIVSSSLTKNTGSNAWNAGAESANSFIGDGNITMIIGETNTYRMFGLSTTNTNNNYNTIHFAIYPNNAGSIHVYENGTHSGNFGTYSTGDTLKVAREGNLIKYYKNSVVLYTSTQTAPTGSLLADVALYSVGSTILNAKMNDELIEWTNLGGVDLVGVPIDHTVTVDIPLSVGLTIFDGVNTIKVEVESGATTSPLRISKAGVIYGLILVEVNDAKASRIRIKTANDGIKALKKI